MGANDALFVTLSHSVSFVGENELLVITGCAPPGLKGPDEEQVGNWSKRS